MSEREGQSGQTGEKRVQGVPQYFIDAVGKLAGGAYDNPEAVIYLVAELGLKESSVKVYLGRLKAAEGRREGIVPDQEFLVGQQVFPQPEVSTRGSHSLESFVQGRLKKNPLLSPRQIAQAATALLGSEVHPEAVREIIAQDETPMPEKSYGDLILYARDIVDMRRHMGYEHDDEIARRMRSRLPLIEAPDLDDVVGRALWETKKRQTRKEG